MRQPTACRGCGEFTRRDCGYCDTCEYVTQPEAVRRLRVGRTTYYRLVNAGHLHPRHIGGGKVLVARAEVDALLIGRAYHEEAVVEVQDRRQLWGIPSYPLAK